MTDYRQGIKKPGLRVEGVTYYRDNHLVLSNVCFEAQAGDVIVVRGRNGSGKTTLLRLLGGILSPTEGVISASAAKAYLGHADGLKPYWRVRDYLKGVEVGLEHLREDLVQTLSAGMKRRLSFARVVSSQAPIWLLDEPLTHLDTEASKIIVRLIEGHRAAGGLVVMSAHQDLLFDHREIWLDATA